MEDRICDTCNWSRKSWTNPENRDLYCGNPKSNNYCDTMVETQSCERWEINDREVHS